MDEAAKKNFLILMRTYGWVMDWNSEMSRPSPISSNAFLI
jgi:hypothetical protein